MPCTKTLFLCFGEFHLMGCYRTSMPGVDKQLTNRNITSCRAQKPSSLLGATIDGAHRWLLSPLLWRNAFETTEITDNRNTFSSHAQNPSSSDRVQMVGAHPWQLPLFWRVSFDGFLSNVNAWNYTNSS